MKKLILLGDSLFGQAGKHRIEMLELALNNNYDIYNCAAGGWDTNDIVKKSAYLAGLKPDVMVLSVGTNDIASWHHVSLQQFEDNLLRILEIWKDSKVIFFLPPPLNEAAQEAPKIRRNSDLKQYQQVAVQICKERGVTYINSWDIFGPLLDAGDSYHIDDGVHLSDDGYSITWSEVAKVLA
ncbi:MAG: hypothetical protein JWO41_537 [Candidatus Saccharibacteria bacterium]|nr:hypothetical protein [Candidatus Saccharibacteria bacterium]